MLTFPNIDPVAIDIGPLQIHWYGLMYLVGFACAWALGRYRASRPHAGWSAQQVDDLIFFAAVGLVVGARIGFVLFYHFAAFLADPLMLFRVWEGGMSFHGGLIGVVVAMWLFQRKTKHSFGQVLDFLVPLAPLGLFAGRIGNFINAELWGRTTDLPWGMVFPGGGPLPRHPSQLYEAFLEGLVLFAVLWIFSSKPRPTLSVAGLFALLYGTFRFAVEFVREPDAHIGYIAFGWLTMGQLLTLPLIGVGIAMLWWAYRSPRSTSQTVREK